MEKQSVVVITGGANGMGLQTARLLAAADLSVGLALIDWNDAALAGAAAELSDRPGRTLALQADVTRSAEVDAAIARAGGTLGQISGLLTAAGIRQVSQPIVEVTDEVWHKLVNVNHFGTFTVARAVARSMIAGGRSGSIVTISSIGGTRARLGQSAYGASKAGVAQLTRTLALELAEHRNCANSICPGLINTEVFKLAQTQDGPELTRARIFGMPERFRPGIPARRIAEPEDVANLICFLLSSAALHISGKAIHIDGADSIV